jgi:hypothetical protein
MYTLANASGSPDRLVMCPFIMPARASKPPHNSKRVTIIRNRIITKIIQSIGRSMKKMATFENSSVSYLYGIILALFEQAKQKAGILIKITYFANQII